MINSTYAASGTLDAVLHSMMDNSRRKLIMASIKSNAFMAWAFASERVEFEDGGANITNPLTVGRNPNVASYQYYDTLPIAQTNEFTTVGYGWSRVAGSLVISNQEQDENKGEAMIFKLLKAKLDVLEESIKEKFSGYLYATGSGTDPYGLGNLIPDDPTSGSIGGLARTEVQWRTSAYQMAGGLDPTNVEEVFDDILLDLKLKDGKPDLILMGRNLIRIYRQAIRDKIVLNIADGGGNGKKMFDLGFEGFKHNGITCLYDEDCGVNRAYFINSKYILLHMLKGVNMKTVDLTAPWNIDAIGKRTIWQGQFCIWKAFRTHAVLRNGTTG